MVGGSNERPVGAVTLGDSSDRCLLPRECRTGLDLWGVDSSLSSGPLQHGSETGDGERPLSSFEQDWHELTVIWADGSICMSPTGVPQPDLPSGTTLEHIATQ